MANRSLFSEIKKYRFAYYFLLPTFLGMVIIHFIPMIQGFVMSTLELNQYTLARYLEAPFIGLKNYCSLLFDCNSPIRNGLIDAIRNTVIYTVVVTSGTLFMGMAVALLINRTFRGQRLVRTLFLFPWIIPTYVVGLLWGFMWQKDIGIINYLLSNVFHLIKEKPFWLIGPNTIWAIIIPTIWRFWPFSMLMLLAGLQTISEDYYEAAAIDGASPWHQFWHITWPLLTPVWSILILFGLIYNTYSFNIVIMMFGMGAGFPGRWGDLLMTNIFRNSFQLWQFGMGASASIMLMLVMVAVVLVWYRIFRNEVTVT